MRVTIFLMFFIFTTNGYTQKNSLSYELGVGRSTFISATGITFGGGINFFKHFKLRYTYAYLTDDRRLGFSYKGQFSKHQGLSYENLAGYFYADDHFLYHELGINYSTKPYKGFKVFIGVKGGINKVYLFGTRTPYHELVKAEETYSFNLNPFIPTQPEKSYYIAPNLILSQKITSFMSIEFGADFRFYKEKQYTYSITNIIIDRQTLVQLQYERNSMYFMNLNASLIFNFGQL